MGDRDRGCLCKDGDTRPAPHICPNTQDSPSPHCIPVPQVFLATFPVCSQGSEWRNFQRHFQTLHWCQVFIP